MCTRVELMFSAVPTSREKKYSNCSKDITYPGKCCANLTRRRVDVPGRSGSGGGGGGCEGGSAGGGDGGGGGGGSDGEGGSNGGSGRAAGLVTLLEALE